MDQPPGRLPRMRELDRIEPGRDHEIAAFDVREEPVHAQHVDHAQEERVVLGNQALCLRRDDHGDLPPLGEPPKLRARSRSLRVEARDYDGQRALAQERCGRASLIGVERARPIDTRRDRLGLREATDAAYDLLPGDITRDLEVDRPWPLACRDAKGAGDDRGRVLCIDARVPFRDWIEERAEIELLVRRVLVAIHRHLTRQRDDRGAVEECLCDTRDEVSGAGTERGEAHGGRAVEARDRVGHEARRRLVMREDDLESLEAQTFEEVDDLSAGMSHRVSYASCLKLAPDHTSDRRHPTGTCSRDRFFPRSSASRLRCCAMRISRVWAMWACIASLTAFASPALTRSSRSRCSWAICWSVRDSPAVVMPRERIMSRSRST